MKTIPTEHQNSADDCAPRTLLANRHHLKHYQKWLDRVAIALFRISNGYRQPNDKWASKNDKPTLLASENKQAVTNIQQLHLAGIFASPDMEVQNEI